MRGCLVLAAVAATLLGASATHAASAVVVYGYPYASHCPRAGRHDVVDRWGMYACNCTSYVAWALHANGQRTNWFIPGAMNAWNWPHVARLKGLAVDDEPAVGAIAAWPHAAPPFGHVAYVTAVRGDGVIDVAEYNLLDTRGRQTFVFDRRSFVTAAGAVFIHVPRRSGS